jgi:hypothetical protein
MCADLGRRRIYLARCPSWCAREDSNPSLLIRSQAGPNAVRLAWRRQRCAPRQTLLSGWPEMRYRLLGAQPEDRVRQYVEELLAA